MEARFSVVLITKNEEKTLPRLFESLDEFINKYNGEVLVCDTGSTDGTVALAREKGALVYEVGEMFIETLSKDTANAINKKFVSSDDEPIVSPGDRLFKFDEARNYISSLASNDMICSLDADEAYTVFDIEAINKFIELGYSQFEYHFVYAHNEDGSPALSFTQSKFFDRTKLKWTNKVHEVLTPIDHGQEIKRMYLDTSVVLLEHWQEQGKEHRSNYLPGLAYDCYLNPTNDRNYFYFSRELFYRKRFKSAIKGFLEHQNFNAWEPERAQGLIYIGDCYGALNLPKRQIEYYSKGFDAHPKRREALLRLAGFYRFNNVPHACAAYANAALAIPKTDFYANVEWDYREGPHDYLYWAYNQIGDRESARFHLKKCLEYAPDSKSYSDELFREYGEYTSDREDLIPKIIYTAWFSEDNSIPEDVQSWIDSQKIEGYKHITLTLDDIKSSHLFDEYMEKCIDSVHEKIKWVKLADYVKLKYLYDTGGIFLDADVEVLEGQNFDELLKNPFVIGDEGTATRKDAVVLCNAVMLSKKENPLIKEMIEEVLFKFEGDDSFCYEAGMDVVNNVCMRNGKHIRVLPSDYFYPQNPGRDLNLTDNTITNHHFRNSWVDSPGEEKVPPFNWPTVSIIIPELGRTAGLVRCLKSIEELDYDQDKIQTIILSGEEETVPQKVKRGVEMATGEYIVYASNDIVFFKDCLKNAITEAVQNGYDLVSFNEGYLLPDEGNICTHFLIRKEFINELEDGLIFHTDFHHVGCDNYLWSQAALKGKATFCKNAKIIHYHFSKSEGIPMDFVYERGWKNVEKDRETLSKKLDKLIINK